VFAGELVQVLTAHVRTNPEPPSRHARTAIPPELDELVMRCLSKDPASRPSSARELGLTLDRFVSAEPWTEERATEWWRAHLPDAAIGGIGGEDHNTLV
jgi:serine/threonine-protein kinase